MDELSLLQRSFPCPQWPLAVQSDSTSPVSHCRNARCRDCCVGTVKPCVPLQYWRWRCGWPRHWPSGPLLRPMSFGRAPRLPTAWCLGECWVATIDHAMLVPLSNATRAQACQALLHPPPTRLLPASVFDAPVHLQVWPPDLGMGSWPAQLCASLAVCVPIRRTKGPAPRQCVGGGQGAASAPGPRCGGNRRVRCQARRPAVWAARSRVGAPAQA